MELLQDYGDSDDEVQIISVRQKSQQEMEQEVQILDVPGDVPVTVIPNQNTVKVLKKIGKKTGERMVLKEHQVNVLKGIYNQPGLLAVHRTGSGKTLLGLAVRRQLKKYWYSQMVNETKKAVYALIVSPKKVAQQYEAEMKRLGYKGSFFKFVSYDSLRNAEIFLTLVEFLQTHKFNVLIFDEAHRLSNVEANTTKQAFMLASYAKFVLCTTATPIVNSPFDLAPLYALVSNERTLPLRKKQFLEEFSVSPTNVISHRLKLESTWQNLVSVYLQTDPADEEYFPTFSITVHTSKMSDSQFSVYQIAEESNKEKLQNAVDLEGNINETALVKLNSFLSQTRQLCNSVQKQFPDLPFKQTSPKLVEIVNYVKKHPKPAIIFSHFLESGIDVLAKILGNEGLSFAVISGQTSSKTSEFVKNYNEGSLDVLLLSVAGSEGLDLKGTRQIHVVDQPWTDTRLKQVIGRGIRYKSHTHLPKAQQHVDVVQWIATKSKTQKKIQKLRGGDDGFEYDDSSDEFYSSSEEFEFDSESDSTEMEGGEYRRRRYVSPERKRKQREKLREKKEKQREKLREKREREREKQNERKEKDREKREREKERKQRQKEILLQKNLERKQKEKERKEKLKNDLAKRNNLPTADEILMIINNRKKQISELFIQVLDCASIETNLLQVRQRSTSCLSPTRSSVTLRNRQNLKLQDLMDEEE